MKSKLHEDVFLNIFVGDNDGETILKQDITSLAQQEIKSFDRSKRSSHEIVKRVSAKYSSHGKKDSNGMIIGQVFFTITNLKFNDGGRYTIEGFIRVGNIEVKYNQTVLSVYYSINLLLYIYIMKILITNMKLFCQWYLVGITLLMSSVIVSQNIELTGNPKVNGTYGGNVTITWNVKSKHNVDVFLNIFSGDTDDGYILDKKVTASTGKKQTSYFVQSGKTPLPEIVNRVYAIYSSDGKKDSNGMIIGEVLFTITNLKFSDSGMYTIAEGFRIYDVINNQTVLSVYSPPVHFGKKIKKSYQIVNGVRFTLSLEFLGNPKPIVTWTLDSSAIASEPGKKVRDNYKYTITLNGNKLPRSCEKKTLSYCATNDVGTVNGSTIIQVEPNLSGNFVEDIMFENYNENTCSKGNEVGAIKCVNITWNKPQNFGKCRTHFEVEFYDDEDSTNKKQILRVNTTKSIINICSGSDVFNSKLFKIETSVFGSNDTFLKKKESEYHYFDPFNSKPPNNKDNENKEKDKIGFPPTRQSKNYVTIVLPIVIALLSLCCVLLLVRNRNLQIQLNKNNDKDLHKKKSNSAKVSEVSTVEGIFSNYMDLQAVRENETYQELTTLQSTPNC